MAVVVALGERRNRLLETKKTGRWEKWLVEPFLQAEKHRVEMSRAKRPGESGDMVIKSITVGSAIYVAISMYWFVKYIIM